MDSNNEPETAFDRHTILTGEQSPEKLPVEGRENRASPSEMTTASPTTSEERIDLTESTDFRPASEFFDRSTEEFPELGHAVTIVWYDQATPLFVCRSHHDAVVPVEWQGTEQVADYDEARAAAYQRLYADGAPCCVCDGTLKELIR